MSNKKLAEQDGISINQFVSSAVAENVRALEMTVEYRTCKTVK